MTPYFYDDFIKDKDTMVFKHEPYFTDDHIHKRLHLLLNWCKLHNLKYNNEQPTLKFNVRQLQIAHGKWLREKPVMVIQTNGGPLQEQPHTYSWTRDIPYEVSQKIVGMFSDQYHIIQVCRHEHNSLPNVEVVHEPLSNMELFSMLLASEKRLLIDSSLQHAAAALGLKSTVLWIGTSPVVFGYGLHKNVVATLPNTVKLPDSYLFDYDFNGTTHECPMFDNNIFNLDEIVESLQN